MFLIACKVQIISDNDPQELCYLYASDHAIP